MSAKRTTPVWILLLCLLVAVLEGVDSQSMGVAAPRMAREFGFSPSQMGLAFSAGVLGLLPGAMLGGRFADRIGRKGVLVASTVVFGLFSLLTAHVSTFALLLAARFLTGLGIGGAMPTLIVLSTEAVSPRLRSTAVSVMYCGYPLGGAMAAFIGVLAGSEAAWRYIFYAGGFLPLIIAPLILMGLPESTAFVNEGMNAQGGRAASDSTFRALFGGRRVVTTLQIWIGSFCTLLVVYFLLNWLPSLIVGLGFSRTQAGITQICFNVGSVIGVLGSGRLMDRWRPALVITVIYCVIAASLFMLAASTSMLWLSAAVLLAGLGAVGAQSILNALAAANYDTATRGTGVGAAVAVGRAGAIVGPLAAGQLLAGGSATSTVVGASVPIIVIAACTALLALRRARLSEP
ncbi:3-(3-hydroxy-phenyl)propionate transporter MhpT [Paraburkholderia steynii]|uniref:3-(3-hydroxy-phenyl)propionate transporter MhpT n=1 Tax=Paraburkholderia steynii TaxID=1245441 RepID=A0A4R0XCF2_9BURK|nr:3-(3-hydroxy-phenyl)propionate transporter MhpT [Paraburkholderia steynii]